MMRIRSFVDKMNDRRWMILVIVMTQESGYRFEKTLPAEAGNGSNGRRAIVRHTPRHRTSVGRDLGKEGNVFLFFSDMWTRDCFVCPRARRVFWTTRERVYAITVLHRLHDNRHRTA
jgi:hypothetical protein